MYTPSNSSLSAPGHFRLGLQGYPGTGKTTGALTFPNCYALDFDHKLPSGVPSTNFWDAAVVDKIKLRGNPKWPANKAGALLDFLTTEGPKFSSEQTILIDSFTMVDAAWHDYINAGPPRNKEGEINTMAIWGMKLDYMRALFDRLRSLACNVVITFHESEKTNVDGVTINKCRPLLQGSFRDQIAGHFTAFFRCVVDPVDKDAEGKVLKVNGQPAIKHGYWWQVRSDDTFDAVTAPDYLVTERFVKPHYNSILKMIQAGNPDLAKSA